MFHSNDGNNELRLYQKEPDKGQSYRRLDDLHSVLGYTIHVCMRNFTATSYHDDPLLQRYHTILYRVLLSINRTIVFCYHL